LNDRIDGGSTISNLQQRTDPFEVWAEAISLDDMGNISDSEKLFETAAKEFFDKSVENSEVALAYIEYSTLMDAFSAVQKCRHLIFQEDFDGALNSIVKAGEIFRATLHFAFLSPFVASCAGLEVMEGLSEPDDEGFQACKNSIALLEQSKLVLSFRDERHPFIEIIDAYIRLAISKALKIESELDSRSGSTNVEVKSKEDRSVLLKQEYEDRLSKIGRKSSRLDYFPLADYLRAMKGAFILGYPNAEELELVNVGTQDAIVTRLGSLELHEKIEGKSAWRVSLNRFQKMKIRVIYRDTKSGVSYNEGCLSLV
jgi:hypothetical protein